MTAQVSLRPPTTSNLPSTDSPSPTIDYLYGTWYASHSSLPLWKTHRNVSMLYEPLEPTKGSQQATLHRMDDTVTYQTLTSDKIKTVHGIDTASGEGAAVWDWRGTGWLKLMSSHWEILGFGQDAGVRWLLVYFASTLVTPVGIDILSDHKQGPSEDTVAAIQNALRGMGDPVAKQLADELFRVRQE